MSNFLSRLKESLDSGKEDETVKSKMQEILEKADTKDINEVQKKASEAVARRKPLTPEEIAKINEQAEKEQKAIDEFDAKMKELAKLKLTEQELLQKELEKKEEPFELLTVVPKKILNPPMDGVSERDYTQFPNYDYPKKVESSEDINTEEQNDKVA